MSTASSSPLENILLAVDGSEHSMAAIQCLCDLPIRRDISPQCRVTALGVLDNRHTHSRAALLGILDRTQAIFHQHGIQALPGLLQGDPAEELARYANEHKPDLIVMGAKGLRATLEVSLGGVAQQMVEYVTCPVWVVRAPYVRLCRVLLASDGSESSQHALNYLKCFPLPANIEMFVAHVLPPLRSYPVGERYWPGYGDALPGATPFEVEEAEKWRIEQEENGRTLLSQVIGELRQARFKATGVLLQGDAATELLHYCKEYGIDLLVSGSRGLSRMSAWLLGSVSRKLIHYAPCSGLIVK